ncbi:hypothetical protein B0J14DRAFT_560707 [Halenospora varia]|nr:hypothetical protein B0J14DRAFT_560707 [Halenospora varia]
MDLNLIVRVDKDAKQAGDEEINGDWWRVTGPIISLARKVQNSTAFHMPGAQEKHLQTRPALEAAIRAASAISEEDDSPRTGADAFWIDAICVPQAGGQERLKTLQSMGFIYAASSSTIVILQEYTWSVIEAVGESWRPMTFEEMEIMEKDGWASRVWTYQELVNSDNTYFTAINTVAKGQFVSAESFLNCIGMSLSRWTKANGFKESHAMLTFPNLSHLSDSLFDWKVAGMLNRSILGVLSNMTPRNFDPVYPKNRILACMGSISQEVNWGPSSAALEEIVEKLMSMCEAKGDYSFIYTSDTRDDKPGKRWRPDPSQPKSENLNGTSTGPANLSPIINWQMDTHLQQAGHITEHGLQLDQMVHLIPAEIINADAQAYIKRFLYGLDDENNDGVYHTHKWQGKTLIEVMVIFMKSIGYTGYDEPQVCETGIFFPQVRLDNPKSIELYASASIEWRFGRPGLIRRKEGDNTKYCAGVFVGRINSALAASLLLD